LLTVLLFDYAWQSSDSFVSSKLEVLLGLMVEILPCHSSAKRHRLDCLYFLIVHVLKSETVKAEFLYFLTVHDSKVKVGIQSWVIACYHVCHLDAHFCCGVSDVILLYIASYYSIKNLNLCTAYRMIR
jgi:hypothetical protein